MERDRGPRPDRSPPAVLVRARGEVAGWPVLSSCDHNKQCHGSEAFVAEEIQWLHVFIDVAPDVSAESASFWSAVLGWPVGEQWPGHPEFRSFTPPAGDSYIHQQIGDHGPRIHFDLEVTDRGTADRLVQLGAVITGYGDGWCPMRSPGGLPFCLVDRVDHARPPAQRFAQHHTRLVQICIDSPSKLHDQEVAFWQQATG